MRSSLSFSLLWISTNLIANRAEAAFSATTAKLISYYCPLFRCEKSIEANLRAGLHRDDLTEHASLLLRNLPERRLLQSSGKRGCGELVIQFIKLLKKRRHLKHCGRGDVCDAKLLPGCQIQTRGDRRKDFVDKIVVPFAFG